MKINFESLTNDQVGELWFKNRAELKALWASGDAMVSKSSHQINCEEQFWKNYDEEMERISTESYLIENELCVRNLDY